MKDRGVPRDIIQHLTHQRTKDRREFTRFRNQPPSMPRYDPDFPDDAADGQIALQAGLPYYYWDGEWHPFGVSRAISYRIEGYIRVIPTGVETTIDWADVLADCVIYDKAFAAKTNDSMVVGTLPNGQDQIVNAGNFLEVTRDVRDDADYETFTGQNFEFALGGGGSPNSTVPIVGVNQGFYVVEGGIGNIGPTPTGGPDPSFPEPFYININLVGGEDFANLSPFNSLRVMTTEIDVVGAFGATWTAARTGQIGGVRLSISHDAGFDIQGYVGLGITKVTDYATAFIGDDPYHA